MSPTTPEEITTWLVATIAVILDVAPSTIDADGPVEDLALESLEAAIMVGDLSDHLGWEVDPEIVFSYETLRAIGAAVASAAP